MMNKDFLKRIKMPYPAKLKQQWGAFQKFWYYSYFKKNEFGEMVKYNPTEDELVKLKGK